MSNVKIRNIKAILTAPSGIDLVAVKVETTEPGLYGLGCATFTQRYAAVSTAVERYLCPILTGRSVDNIEDIWQTAMGSSYWRNGPVLNNAISGVDQALWDIKGKMAGMPVYELFGGKCREGVAVYRHADGDCPEQVEENVRRYMEEGYRYVRCQMGVYGGRMIEYGGGIANVNTSPCAAIVKPNNAPAGAYYNPYQYMKNTVQLFSHLRKTLGDDVQLLHDIHERLAPIDALRLAKELEPYHLFFLEDALPPEQLQWFRKIRCQSSTPIAMGELFNNPLEWRHLITEGLIDFIRVHLSQIGGLTPARKLAALCEAFGVRTAWHGPGDITPIGVAAQLHLDLAIPNFGIQEFAGFTEQDKEVFIGCPEVKNGYLYASEKPGFGIELDEKAAQKYPCKFRDHDWLFARLPDGTSVRP